VKFSVTIGLREIGEFDNFFDAFKLFFDKIMESLEKGTCFQVLETMNWIEIRAESGCRVPLMFYDARDLAFDSGILVPPAAKGQPPTVVPPPEDAQGHAAYVEKLRIGIIGIGERLSAEDANGIADVIREIFETLPALESPAGRERIDDADGLAQSLREIQEGLAAATSPQAIENAYRIVASEL